MRISHLNKIFTDCEKFPHQNFFRVRIFFLSARFSPVFRSSGNPGLLVSGGIRHQTNFKISLDTENNPNEFQNSTFKTSGDIRNFLFVLYGNIEKKIQINVDTDG